MGWPFFKLLFLIFSQTSRFFAYHTTQTKTSFSWFRLCRLFGGVRHGTSNSRMYLNCLLFGQGSHCSLVTFIPLCTSNNILCEDSKFVDY
jgi:hypothetical protein